MNPTPTMTLLSNIPPTTNSRTNNLRSIPMVSTLGHMQLVEVKNITPPNYHFLQKIEVVLRFLAEQPFTAKGLHKGYHTRNSPKVSLAKSLQDAEFIPDTYKAYGPAVFVDSM